MKSLSDLKQHSMVALDHLREKLSSSTAVKSALWVVFGNIGSQVIRLISNLILTRLLFPEVFGLMVIVYTVIIGLGQLSDVGLREGVVNSNRVNEKKFLETAWTMNILRAAFMAFFAILLADPVARFYGNDILSPMLVCIAFLTFISGFKSISLYVYDKRLELKTQVIMEVGVQVVGILVTIVWAWHSPSVWALVAGHAVATVLEVVLSFLLFDGRITKMSLEMTSVKQLFGFGKWIVISSSISYITVQGDKLIMGKFLTFGELGKYSIAATWSSIVALFSVSLSARILHPYFKKALEKKSGFNSIARLRNLLNGLYMAICVCLALIGDKLIVFLYDERYVEAGWMLQILALGQVGRSLSETLRPFLMAAEDSFSQMVFSICTAILLIVLIIYGGYFYGAVGVIVAYAVTGIIAHPIMIACCRKHDYQCVVQDFSIILIALIVCIFGWFVMDSPAIEVIRSLRN